MIAEALPEFQGAQVLTWVGGLVGVMAIAALCLSVVNGARKLFAHEPSVNEQIARLSVRIDEAEEKIDAVVAKMGDSEKKLEGKINEEFRALDHKRAVSIAGLHDVMRQVSTSVNQLGGEMKQVTSRLSDVAASAEAAGLQAARAAATADAATRSAR